LGLAGKRRSGERGIEYRISEQAKNIYRELVPLLNSGKIELLEGKPPIEIVGAKNRQNRLLERAQSFSPFNSF
jgi:hypothetical protein